MAPERPPPTIRTGRGGNTVSVPEVRTAVRDGPATGGFGGRWWPAGCRCAGTRAGLDGRATSDGWSGGGGESGGGGGGGWGSARGTRGGGRGRTGRGPVSGARGAEGPVGGSA
jgi:hypothetical protein